MVSRSFCYPIRQMRDNRPTRFPILASQGTEHLIMILSLVKTKGTPGFIGNKQRTNVATSRQKEALYFGKSFQKRMIARRLNTG